MSWRDRLKHAFAVESKSAIEPTAAQQEVVDRVANEIARRHLTTPALVFLEMSRPLNFVTAQAMHFFQPIAAIVLDTAGYERFAEFLEHRGSVEFLCRRIEHFEAAYERTNVQKSEVEGQNSEAKEQTPTHPSSRAADL